MDRMRVAIVNLLMRTVKSTLILPQFDGSLPRHDIEVDSPMVVLVADQLARMGNDVDVFAGSIFKVARDYDSNDERLANIVYERERLRFVFPPSYYPFAPDLLRRLREEKYDVILSSEILQPCTGLSMAGKPKGTKLFVWQELGSHPRFPVNAFSRPAFLALRMARYRHFDRVIPRSKKARQFLVSEGVPEARISRIIPNAVDCSTFTPRQATDYLEERSMAEASPHPRVIMISRIDKDKGVETFLKAANTVRESGTNASYILKGTGPDMPRIRRLADSLGLSKDTLFIENYLPRKQLAGLLASCDICVAPSSGDLLFFVPLEAIASGVPVITSLQTHHSDTFSNGEAGVLVPANNVESLADEITQLIGSPRRLKDMSRRARELAVREFSVESVAQRLASEFTEESTG